MASIRIETGPQPGKTIVLDKDKVTFGRNYSCDCVLKHPTVSRDHFYIERNAGKYFVVDQDSNNGTFANEKRVSWVELRDGDKIRAGPFTMTVELEGERAKEGSGDFSAAASMNQAPSYFDKIHANIYPREYLQGIEHFNSRRYFEAHEAWEEIWLRSEGEAKVFYQMLIQAAVGLHHYERGNARGATGMYKNVREKLARLPAVFMSLDLHDFSRQFKSFFVDLIDNGIETPHPAEHPRPLIHLLGDQVND
jgi:predicted metal-dependent hydrolase